MAPDMKEWNEALRKIKQGTTPLPTEQKLGVITVALIDCAIHYHIPQDKLLELVNTIIAQAYAPASKRRH